MTCRVLSSAVKERDMHRWLIVLVFAACQAAPSDIEGPPSLAVDGKTDSIPEWLHVDAKLDLGELFQGVTQGTWDHQFAGIRIDTAPGIQLHARVAALDGGDAVLWLTDDRFNVLAFDDNGGGGRDASFHLRDAGGTRFKWLVYRERSDLPVSFRVSVGIGVGIDEREPDEETCPWGGQTLRVGDEVPRGDGCNVCICEKGGLWCTMKGCG
jgi:hypothetical protein